MHRCRPPGGLLTERTESRFSQIQNTEGQLGSYGFNRALDSRTTSHEHHGLTPLQQSA